MSDLVYIRREDLEDLYYGYEMVHDDREVRMLKRVQAILDDAGSVPPGGCHKLCDYPIGNHSKDCRNDERA